MRRRHRSEEAHYQSQRDPSDAMNVLSGPPRPDAVTWMQSSIGAWLPADKRAAYLAELQGKEALDTDSIGD